MISFENVSSRLRGLRPFSMVAAACIAFSTSTAVAEWKDLGPLKKLTIKLDTACVYRLYLEERGSNSSLNKYRWLITDDFRVGGTSAVSMSGTVSRHGKLPMPCPANAPDAEFVGGTYEIQSSASETDLSITCDYANGQSNSTFYSGFMNFKPENPWPYVMADGLRLQMNCK